MKNTHTKIESIENGVAGEEDAKEYEPEKMKIHDRYFTSCFFGFESCAVVRE